MNAELHADKVAPLARPLNVMFMITSMPVGGAETLLVNLVRKMDRQICMPEIACLKEPGELGAQISREIPLHSGLIRHKYDVAVVPRLRRLFRARRTDAVITVGAGDKMFWGRLAARYSGLPVILSALHSTGWPDGVGRFNRMLTGITDGFIAVARPHAEYLVAQEKFPPQKVFMIPNGVDTRLFAFDQAGRDRVRAELHISPAASVVGIVAALRAEKNHELFLQAAREVYAVHSSTRFVIVGDGPQRAKLEELARSLGLASVVHFLGSRSDIPAILSALDLFVLTSHNEASPVSILEAMSCSRPVVAPDVGSISQAVLDGRTGLLVPKNEWKPAVEAWLAILRDSTAAANMGAAARAHVIQYGSLEAMTRGYEDLVRRVYLSKRRPTEVARQA
jgi:glycosyltransferase involved in cell wall biosynthesis